MDTYSVEEVGFSTIHQFIGVFPIDKVPHTKLSKYAFIVNNQTSNLPGEHWIAVRVCNKKAYIFDPLGLPPPAQLTNHLKKYRIEYNKIQYQPTNSTLCGQYALTWLINNSMHWDS